MQSNNHLLTHCRVICCPDHSERRETRGIQNICLTKKPLFNEEAEKKSRNHLGSNRSQYLLGACQN